MTKSEQDTINHKDKVAGYVYGASQILNSQGLKHDDSKLQSPEREGFEIVGIKLKDIKYPSQEYTDALKELKPYLDHHYANNSHHPEHFDNGVDGMTLFDVIEMLCDWKASGERMKDGGSIYKSIKTNKDRFKLSDQLASIMKNTVKKMEWADLNSNEDGEDL